MKVDLTRPDKHVALLTVELDADRVRAARSQVYRRMAGRYNIPGFRRGKAPQPILERYVGQAFFDQEVLDELLASGYPEALAVAGVEPVDSPELDIREWEARSVLRFTAKVTTKPPVELGQYTGIEVPQDHPVVTDQDVEDDLGRLREEMGKFVELSREEPLSHGGVALIDFSGRIDGEPFAGGEAQAYPLQLGSGTFLPGFEEQLAGARPGEDREVTITFPETYAPELAGKTATFKVHVHAHLRRELPELDDALAKEAASRFGLATPGGDEGPTLAWLRGVIRQRMELAASRRARSDFEERVLAKVTAGAQVDLPEVMIERGVQARYAEYADTFRRNGSTIERYLEERQMTAEQLRQGLRPAVIEGLRRELVLEAITRLEGLAATDREVDERITSLAQAGGEEPAALRARLTASDAGPGDDGGDKLARLRDAITRRKVIDFLVGAQVAVPPAGNEIAGGDAK